MENIHEFHICCHISIIQTYIVWLHHSCGDLRGRVDGELKLGLLSIVDREALHEEGSEARSSASTKGVEDEESLEPSALVCQLADAVQDEVNHLLANRVVSTSIVVGSILLTRDHLLRVEELPVGARPDLIDHGGLQVHEDCPGNVLAGPSLGEEGGEGVIALGLVRGHLPVGLNAVLEAVELPAGVAHLDAGLADVDGDALAHVGVGG